MLLLLSADFFSKLTFAKNSFRNTIRVSNGLDPDQDRQKGNQQMTEVAASQERVYSLITRTKSIRQERHDKVVPDQDR